MGNFSCKTCKKKKTSLEQAGSVLDRVISQSSNEDQCLLYQLANYKKGGELIDAYNIGGQIEVEKLIKEKFGMLMYSNGAGKIINRAEYLRWKFRGKKQVILPIEASFSNFDPLAKWEDHEACWQMQYRGSLGETLLHVLIICDTRIHTKLARILLKCFPKLAMDIVEGEEYLGASALHLAIAYSNNELVQELVEAGANVNQRATGSFFLPKDQQKIPQAKYTDYEGLAYLGEYPLAWAACCANESVYNLLLEVGAHPDYQDSFGNMILHMVVVCDKLDMFGYALRHPKLPASNGVVNKAGLTPLTLACKLGRDEVFREMLELSAKEFWRYSNITCSAYPLNALDTLLPNGKTNWNSALFIILNGTKEEHLNMLDGGIIQRLLEEKWKTFARNQFLKRLLILVAHLLCLSGAVYLRPKDDDESLLIWPDDFTTLARYACEIGTLIGVLSYVIFQQGDEIKNQGLWTFLKQQSHSPPKAIFLISNLLILACIPFRILGDKETEEAILVFAVPGSWFLLMFFAGAIRLTGPFVTMIYSMITGDMLTFGIIYTIVLFGFSQSFYFLYKGYPGVKNTLYSHYYSTWMALFQITLGDYNYSDLANTTYPTVSKTVFAIFMVFVPILLLNMLIAMMGNTYAHVLEQSEKEWVKQWAKIVVTLERAVAKSDARHYLEEYSIRLGPGDEPGTEQRGVMVIKSKSKTRAKQRKGALANWKHVGKVTINELRKRGLTGEQMRCLMWGRESISTPIKTKRKTATINPLTGELVGNEQNVSTGALTAALDVIAFTHDINIETTNNIKNIIKSQNTNEFIDPLIENKPNQNGIKNEKSLYEDPLRELVMLSEKENLEKLEILAGKAASLYDIDKTSQKGDEIFKIQDETKQKSSGDTLQKCQEEPLSNGLLNNIFLSMGNVNMAKKKFEEKKKKPEYSLFNTSDSDDFGETPLLGKRERQRRVKSANLSKQPKLNMITDESFDDNISFVEIEYEKLQNKISFEEAKEIVEESDDKIQETKDFILNNDKIKIEDLRPINIDDVLERIKNEFSSGSESSQNNSTKKILKKSRPKTGKHNRIAPEIQPRRNKSAKYKKKPDSPPDFLEPWSTKNIVDMNTILSDDKIKKFEDEF